MNAFRSIVLCTLALAVGSMTMAQDKPAEPNYDEAKVPRYTLPDPLVMADGRAVKSIEMWRNERRPELLDLFATEMFGRATLHRTGNPFRTTFENLVSENVFDGKGVRHQFEIVWTKPGEEPHRVHVVVYVPKTTAGKTAPAFMGLNFQGNHTISADPGIKLAPVWDRSKKILVQPTEEDRGKAARRWPIEMLLNRGYALVTAHYCDIEPDFNGGIYRGVRRFLYKDGEKQKPDEANTIATWVWGLGEMLDAVTKLDLGINPKKVAVIGHSRLGKTSLWAGAVDPRFAMVVSNDSGCGGSALSRREFGETVHRINVSFPHWFCDNFKKYNKSVNTLPFDQHELIALIAPRPVYIASATEDLWADPKGEFLAALGADPVYRLNGTDGIAGVTEPPEPDKSVGGTIRYHNRTGKHDIIEFDWKQYCDFADKYLK